MAKLRNLPTDRPQSLKSLISPKENQVVSMALSRSDEFQMTLFTFADKEIVSEEEYFGDTMYYIIEGETDVTIDNKVHHMKAGDVFQVNSHVLHEIGGKSEFKLLQITVKE